MELLQHSGSSSRPYLMGSSSAPTFSYRQITRRVLTKAAILLALMSLLGMATAAQGNSQPTTSTRELVITRQ